MPFAVEDLLKRIYLFIYLLRGHNDGRGGLVFDTFSGWLILNLPRVRNGIIVVKIECWHKANRAWKTQVWTSIHKHKGVTDDRLLTFSNQNLEEDNRDSSSIKTEPATETEPATDSSSSTDK